MSVPGLSATDSAKYVAALNESCDVRTLVTTMTLSHALVASIEPLMLDGQINVVQGDGANATRTLQMGLYDPDHELRLDSASPGDGVGGMDRLIQVRTYVRSDATEGVWLGAPACTVRPTTVGRDGDVVTIEAQGKERIHMRTIGRTSVAKGTYHVVAIKAMLQRSGETRFRFPTAAAVPSRLARIEYYGGPDPIYRPWTRAWELAKSIGMQLLYDTAGFACLRPAPAYGSAPAWTLLEQGPGANTISRVKRTTDLTTIKNQAVVYGKTAAIARRGSQPAQASRLLTAVASAPANHPYSGQSNLMNGASLVDTEFLTRDDLHTQAAVNAFAAAALKNLLAGQTDIECTTLPVWHLEPLDILRLVGEFGNFDFRLKDASIPLGPSETGMTIGYRLSVRSPSAGRLRR